MKKLNIISILILIGLLACNDHNQDEQQASAIPGQLFEYSDNIEPRWISFENITGEKGQGGKENFGAKGHPCDFIKAGETKTLLDIAGPGIINRMWITISDRSPEMLRSLVLNMYWDGESKPAVSSIPVHAAPRDPHCR